MDGNLVMSTEKTLFYLLLSVMANSTWLLLNPLAVIHVTCTKPINDCVTWLLSTKVGIGENLHTAGSVTA